ncbi:hypothetical protein EDD11_007742 [Mortierella claussenii]|nr:hypothetical protein EDD11_007742 [Mortierella claussenii]
MSSTDVIAPSMVRPKRGLASFKTMFSSKRQTIAQIPDTKDSNLPLPSPSSNSVLESSTTLLDVSSSPSSSHKAPSAVSSMFAPNQKRAQEKAAEKEKKDQVKQAIQLSIVDEQGAFLPPTPLEKGYKEHFKDNDEDYFQTIISTPPERVRTFLSAASTISPGMFSLPSSKIKRHTLPASFMSNQQQQQQRRSSPDFADVNLITPLLSSSPPPPMVPPKDAHYTPKQQPTKKNNSVQIAYLTGTEDLTEALSESIGSLLSSSGPSSPLQEVPDLMMDDDDHSSSESSSATPSPRHSTASLQQQHRQATKMQAMDEHALGGELSLVH